MTLGVRAKYRPDAEGIATVSGLRQILGTMWLHSPPGLLCCSPAGC